MLIAIEGIYDNGKIQLSEIPANIPPQTKVIVTFLELPKANIGEPPYTDLDHMIGTWTEEEVDEFMTNTKQFREIDRNLWQ